MGWVNLSARVAVVVPLKALQEDRADRGLDPCRNLQLQHQLVQLQL